LTSRTFIAPHHIAPRKPHRRPLEAVAFGVRSLPLTFNRAFWRLVGLLLNIGLFMVLFQVYKVGRKTFIQRGETVGFANAEQIIHWQQSLHFFVELDVQQWILQRPEWVIRGINYYYAGFMPIFYICCGLALLFGPAQWRFWRQVFVISMVLALPWYAIYPLAPPRFMTDHGFVDTLAIYGPNYFKEGGMVTANRFAAMPSMHIGWSTIGALMLVACLPKVRGFRIGLPIGIVHVMMMTLTVIATGNHYILDAVGGWIIVAASMLVAWKLTDRIPVRFPRLLSPD